MHALELQCAAKLVYKKSPVGVLGSQGYLVKLPGVNLSVHRVQTLLSILSKHLNVNSEERSSVQACNQAYTKLSPG